MLVYYFVPFIVSNHYLLFWVSNDHKSVTVQNRTHVYMNFFDHKDLGNHLLQLCPKVVKHPVLRSRAKTRSYYISWIYKNMLRLLSVLVFMIEVIRLLKSVHTLQPKVFRWHTCWTFCKVLTLAKFTGSIWVGFIILLWWHTWWRKQSHLPKNCVFSSKITVTHEAQYMCYLVQIMCRLLLTDRNQTCIDCSAWVQRTTKNFHANP